MEFKNKKLQSPPYEEMELSQRTGQLLIICLMGRGTPVTVNLYPRAPEVSRRQSRLALTRRSEVGGQKSEIRGRKTEGFCQLSVVRKAWSIEHGVKDKKRKTGFSQRSGCRASILSSDC